MPTGRSTQITKQRGEYLVAAELSKRGLFVATFSGNVPDFDLVAVRDDGSTSLVQVKAITGPSWQFKIDDFAVVDDLCDVDGELSAGSQVLGDLTELRNPAIIWVMVQFLGEAAHKFWVAPQGDVQAVIVDGYQKMLSKHEGRRPRQWRSHHTAIWPAQIEKHAGRWDLITGMAAVSGSST